MELNILGIALAKSVFQLHGTDKKGKAVLKKKLGRTQLLRFVANLPTCFIGMESCAGSHYWAREFQKLGHEVRLVSPQFVRPYVKSNKNDAADAEAICEAVSRPNMRFVPIKQVAHQDIQSLHRIRERLVKSKTATINEVRGLLHEYGIILPQSVQKFRQQFCEILEQHKSQLSTLSYQTFLDLFQEFRELDEKVQFYDKKIKEIHDTHPVCQRLTKIPGVGPLTATAMVAAAGDPKAFKNGRQLSAWLGLVPRQHSSGGKDKLLGISKRGDVYLRKLVVHGARTTARWAAKKTDHRSIWLKKLIERRGMNRAIVALANKNVRTMWVLMSREEEYRSVA